jgi:hypothetical protein
METIKNYLYKAYKKKKKKKPWYDDYGTIIGLEPEVSSFEERVEDDGGVNINIACMNNLYIRLSKITT